MPAVAPDRPPAGASHTSKRGRFVVSTILVALVVAAGSGVGTFALHGGFAVAATPTDASSASPVTPVGQSVDCGEPSRCIPSLQATDVVRPLEANRFACDAVARGWICDLWIGTTHFDLQLTPPYDDETLIAGVTASVIVAPESDLNDMVVPFLTWAAALPFGNDAAGLQVRQWATQQIESGTDARARIGGYTYAVTHEQISSGRSIRLEIDPILGFEDELWGDS